MTMICWPMMTMVNQQSWIFFATVDQKLASKFPPSAMDADSLSFITRVTPTISNITIRHEDFSSKLAKINIRKAHGHDGISSREIKIVSKDIGYLIASIEAKWTMRKAHIQVSRRMVKSMCCTGKGGDSADFGNCRPLTMLSILSKIAESVLCDTIDVHLNEVLHQNQSEVIESHFYCYSYPTESWKHHMDEGKVLVQFL